MAAQETPEWWSWLAKSSHIRLVLAKTRALPTAPGSCSRFRGSGKKCLHVGQTIIHHPLGNGYLYRYPLFMAIWSMVYYGFTNIELYISSERQICARNDRFPAAWRHQACFMQQLQNSRFLAMGLNNAHLLRHVLPRRFERIKIFQRNSWWVVLNVLTAWVDLSNWLGQHHTSETTINFVLQCCHYHWPSRCLFLALRSQMKQMEVGRARRKKKNNVS